MDLAWAPWLLLTRWDRPLLNQAVEHLLEKGVEEDKIVFLNVVCSPGGIHNLCGKYPNVHVVTCCIDKGLAKSRLVYPGVGNFGDRYFGTEEEQ